MWNRWAALPRGIRWPVGIAAVVLAAAIVWALFVPVADWLAHHDVGSVKGSLHETALDNARGRLLTLGAGLFAAGALVFTARNFAVSRRTLELTEQGQVTDRYTKAIEQLGSDKLDVCIGGIYALERVARDSARDHPTVMEVLTAFIREHSHEQGAPSAPGSRGQARSTRSRLGLAIWTRTTRTPSQEQARSPRPDIQAAVTVVGRRDQERDIRPIDLAGANLAGVNLAGVNLTRAHLARANLGSALLAGADLAHADLTRANLTGADLTGADLTGAYLRRADLARASLARANLTRANLTGADLTGADLTGATLSRTNFGGAYLGGAYLTGADLTGATLTGADLAGTDWLVDTPVPKGWERDASSGQLVSTGPDPDRTVRSD
jgi:uncharacterized protein YjbI with pentapeptide repeats